MYNHEKERVKELRHVAEIFVGKSAEEFYSMIAVTQEDIMFLTDMIFSLEKQLQDKI